MASGSRQLAPALPSAPALDAGQRQVRFLEALKALQDLRKEAAPEVPPAARRVRPRSLEGQDVLCLGLDFFLLVVAELPPEARARSAAVSRPWHAAVNSFWTTLDLSWKPTHVHLNDAALLAAVRGAPGELRSLDLTGQRCITPEGLQAVLVNSAGIVEVSLDKHLSHDDLTLIVNTESGLRLLMTPLQCSVQEAGLVLQRKGAYASVQLTELRVNLRHDSTVDALMNLLDMVTAHNDECKVTLALFGEVFEAADAPRLGDGLRLKAGSRLTHVCFHDRSFNDGSLLLLVRSFCENASLSHLSIVKSNLQGAFGTQLASFLRDNAALTFVMFREDNIGDLEAAQFAESLHHNTTLRFVFLEYNNIGDEGAARLEESLRHNKAVSLFLSGNNISDAVKAELGARSAGRMIF